MVFWAFVHCDCLFGSCLGCLSHKTGPGLKFLLSNTWCIILGLFLLVLKPKRGRSWFLGVLFNVIACLGEIWDA